MKSAHTALIVNATSGVCTITLNRPDVFNALNEAMLRELLESLKEAERDPSVRCLVIRGAGEKAFCSGQDLKERAAQENPPPFRVLLSKLYHPVIRLMRSIEKPIIGMINGVAAGAGLSLALACDLRYMSDTARLIQVFVRLGLVPDSGANWFLPRLVGLGKAFEHAALGQDILPEEAERVGLVNKVLPASELEAAVSELANRIARGPTRAIGLIKRTMNKALVSDLETTLEYEAYIQEIVSRSEDHREGVQAFLEKRSAQFHGL